MYKVTCCENTNAIKRGVENKMLCVCETKVKAWFLIIHYLCSQKQHHQHKYNARQGKIQSLFKYSSFRHKHPKRGDHKK